MDKSVILSGNSTKCLNLAILEPDLHDKINALTMMQNQAYVHIDDNGYIGLTQKGGKFWENKFLIDWNLYFGCGGQFREGKEFVLFYAKNQATLNSAIKQSDLLNDCEIKMTEKWQPIY